MQTSDAEQPTESGVAQSPAPLPAAPHRGELPAPGWLSRFMWFCAGADAELLKRCPGADRVKYEGVGGIVLATAVLAFASGSYAFYTVFEPKTEMALGRVLDQTTLALALSAGLVWALVIFNIDRFIVSSSGKGDGTDRITLDELAHSLPRLVMAMIIGVCISAPLEIRILKPEIDAQLELEQNQYRAQLDTHTEARYQARKDDLRSKLEAGNARLDERAGYFEKRRLEINEQRRLLELEAEGKTGSGVAGRGPAWQDKKDTLDQMMAELERDRARDVEESKPLRDEIERWKRDLGALGQELDQAKLSNLRQARHLDGLMKRIHVSHEIGGLVPLFILLLLLAIETGPVFFKMMLTRGAYEYLQENARRLAVARAGIEIDAQLWLPETQEALRHDAYHQAEAVALEERRRLQAEVVLAEQVYERFREQAATQMAKAQAAAAELDSERTSGRDDPAGA